MFSSLRLFDRWMTASEILPLDLSGATVVLSACESARSMSARGDEMLGLARAFLGAGASTLVASLWPADDAVTARLMEHWYDARRLLGPADALRQAQLEVLAEHPHPYQWAPFVTIGAA
jgi:CHAT domain-containing protein